MDLFKKQFENFFPFGFPFSNIQKKKTHKKKSTFKGPYYFMESVIKNSKKQTSFLMILDSKEKKYKIFQSSKETIFQNFVFFLLKFFFIL